MSESSEFSWGSKESVAFIVSRSPLWVLSPEIALVVAQEEHDLHPSFLGHVFCTKIPLMLCQNPGKRMEKPQWHLTRSDLLQGPKQLSAVFISKKMDQNRNPLPKKDSLWKAYNLHHMKWTLTYLDRLDLKSRYLKISQDISWYLKISQDISRYLKISQGQLSTFAILCPMGIFGLRVVTSQPSFQWNLGDCCNTMGHVRKPQRLNSATRKSKRIHRRNGSTSVTNV